MANENVMWRIIWFCVFMILVLLGLISPIDNKTTIPLQIIRAGLIMIYRLLK